VCVTHDTCVQRSFARAPASALRRRFTLWLQAELRAKQEEDEREKQAALAEMKKLTDKIFLEGYARQASLAELRAREDRIAHQIALLKQSQSRFEQASPSNAAASSPAAAANDVADVPRCVEAIKMLQAKHHGGANEVVLVSRLGLAINPKVTQPPPHHPPPLDSRSRSTASRVFFSRTRR
jgi:hypothetical protein